MGHGCYYTNNITKTKAFWIDVDPYYEDEETGEEMFDDYAWDDEVGNLTYELEKIGYTQDSDYEFHNGLFNVVLESGHGHEIIIRLEPRGEEQYYIEDIRVYNLALANHCRSYRKIGKHLLSLGYKLRIATSGYTSTEYQA
jgi:hypothetical protein